MAEKYKEQPRITVDGIEHTVRTADKKILQRKLKSTPTELQRSLRKDLSPNKHKLRARGESTSWCRKEHD